MTTKQHSHYLKFLSKGHNILLLSDNHYEQFQEVSKHFMGGCQRNITEVELDNITSTLMSNKIDIVLFDFTKKSNLNDKFFDAIVSYNERIDILGILPTGEIDVAFVSKLDRFLIEPFSEEELRDNLFCILSVYYTIKSVSRREVHLVTGCSDVSDELEVFFDMYEGSSIFIVDELVEYNKALKSGELSVELLKNISKKFLEIVVFSLQMKQFLMLRTYLNLSQYTLTN